MLDKPLTKRQTRLLRVKAKQHNAVCKIMQREHSPYKNIVTYVRDIRECLTTSQREMRDAQFTLNLIYQLRNDDNHEDMTLEEYVSTLFAKIKRLNELEAMQS
jgi:hypothetical protein